MKVSKACVFSLALGLTAGPVFAAEGVLVVQKTTVGTNSRTSHVQIEKDRMRTEVESPIGEKQVVMFDGQKQVLTIVYVDRKAYAELTRSDVDQMAAQMSTSMKMSPAMQEQLAKMPPGQRALAESMMRGGSAPPPAKMEYRKTGTDKAGKWACDKYEGFQNNVKKIEICTVAPKTLGIAPNDFDVAKQMAEFFAKMNPAAQGTGTAFEVGTMETVGFNGVPVRSIGYGSKGEVLYTSELVDISRQNFPPSGYEVPAGFQKQAPFAGRGAKP